MLKEVLSSRTKQRLILAARAADKSERESTLMMQNEADDLLKPGVPVVGLATGIVSIVGQRLMKKPTALVAGAEEFFKKR